MWRKQRTLTALRIWRTRRGAGESCRVRGGGAPAEELHRLLRCGFRTQSTSSAFVILWYEHYCNILPRRKVWCFEMVRIIWCWFICQGIFRVTALTHPCFLSRHHGCWSPGMKMVKFWHLLERWFWNLHLIYMIVWSFQICPSYGLYVATHGLYMDYIWLYISYL